MSTRYYALREPLTNVEVREVSSHSLVTLWVNHGCAGGLTIRSEEVKPFLRVLFDDEGVGVMRTAWGGREAGAVLTDTRPDDPGWTPRLDEYGRLLTAGQVRARHGAKRKDGMATELFGYEGSQEPSQR